MRSKVTLKRVLVANLIMLFSQLLVSVSYADDASVLPKGVFRATMDSNLYFPIDKRYDPDGKPEDLAVNYNGNLNSTVFTALAPLDPLVPGLPSIGRSIVSFEYDYKIVHFGLQYGLTDRFTIGMEIPYYWVRNKVKAIVDSGPGSGANVGKNAARNRLLPLTTAGTVPLTTEDVQNLLGRGLDINGDGRVDIAGFGYKRFETWSTDAIGDIEAGFRYQYLRTEDWRLAFTTSVKFPTGRVDDPDRLTDFGLGTGAYALRFRLNNDYILSNLWKDAAEETTGQLVLNGTFRYDVQLPDKQKKRVPGDVNAPITLNKEVVERDLGDFFHYEVSARYALLRGLSFSGLYEYGFRLKDRVTGNKGFPYRSLEGETAATEHTYRLGLSYSTLPLYRENKFPFPLTVSITYRNRFKGSNNLLQSQYISLGLQAFF